MKTLLLMIVFIQFPLAQSNLQGTDPLMFAIVSKKEAEFVQLLKKNGKKEQEITQSYFDFSERLVMQREYLIAEWLFERLSKRKDLKDEEIVLINSNLALLNLRLENFEKGLSHVEVGLKKIKSIKNTKLLSRLYYLKVKLSGKLIDEVLTKDETVSLHHLAIYNQDLFFHQVLVQLSRSKFQDALNMFENKDIKNATENEKIIYDFAKAFTHSKDKTKDKKENNYYCQSLMQQGYLAGLTVSDQACPILIAIGKGEKISRDKFNEFKSTLKNDAPDLQILGQLLNTYIK